MADALALHDQILIESVEENEGSIFKHTGDGIAASFRCISNLVYEADLAPRYCRLDIGVVRQGGGTGAEVLD